jgi:hypothetical protein
VRAAHPEQGWSLLCNGVILFDDGCLLLPDGAAIGRPARSVAVPLHRGSVGLLRRSETGPGALRNVA